MDYNLFNMYMTIPYILLLLFSIHIFHYSYLIFPDSYLGRGFKIFFEYIKNKFAELGSIWKKNIVLVVIGILGIGIIGIGIIGILIVIGLYGTSKGRYDTFIFFAVIYFLMLLFSGFMMGLDTISKISNSSSKSLLLFLRKGMYRPKLSNSSSEKIGTIFWKYIIYIIMGYTLITMYNYNVYYLADKDGASAMKSMISFVQFNFGLIFFIYLMSFVKTYKLFEDNYDSINKTKMIIFFYGIIVLCFAISSSTSWYFHDIFNKSQELGYDVLFGVIVAILSFIGVGIWWYKEKIEEIPYWFFLLSCGIVILALIIFYTLALSELITNSENFASIILVNLSMLLFVGLFVFLISKVNFFLKIYEKIIGKTDNESIIKYINYFILIMIFIVVWIFYLNVFSIKIKKKE